MFFGFIYLSLLTKNLGSEESGQYFFYLSILSTLQSISTFGIPTYFEQKIPKLLNLNNKENLMTLIKSAIIFSLLVSFFLILITILFINIKVFEINILTKNTFFKFLFVIPLMIIVSFFSKIIQTSGKNLISVIISNFLFSLLFLIFIFLFNPKTVDSFINIFLLIYLFLAILSFYLLPFKDFYKSDYKIKLSNIAKKSLSFFLVGVIYEYGMQLTTLFLGTAGINSDIAGYAISLKISSVVSFALLAVHHFYITKISASMDSHKYNLLKSLLMKSMINLLFLCLGIFSFIYFFRISILDFFGEEFIQFENVLIINLFSYLFYSIGGLAAMYLISANLEKKMLKNAFFIFLLATILNYLFIYEYGAIAGSLVFLFTNFLLAFSNIFVAYMDYRKMILNL